MDFDSAFWTIIHAFSFIYPKEPNLTDKKTMFFFINDLKEIIPCDICKKHFENYINDTIFGFNLRDFDIINIKNRKSVDLDKIKFLDSREKMIKWGINFHNIINSKNSKKIYNYGEIKTIYEDIIKKSYLLRKYSIDKDFELDENIDINFTFIYLEREKEKNPLLNTDVVVDCDEVLNELIRKQQPTHTTHNS